MKFIFAFLTSILLFSNGVQAQTAEEVQSHLLQYFQSIIHKDHDTFYNLLAPSYKKHLPKDSVMNLLFNVDRDERYINQIVDFHLEKELSDPVIYDNIIYIKLDYQAERHLVYTSNASDDFIKKTNTKFKKIHPDNFEYIASERKMITTNPASVILCIDNGTKWYFIPYRSQLYPYMHLLIPQEVVDELLKN
jgi:hypothetical protein